MRDNWRTDICPVDLSPQAIRTLFDHWLAPPERPEHVPGMVRAYDSPKWEEDGFVTRRMATNYVRDCHFLVDTLAHEHGWTDCPVEPPEPHEGKRTSENPWPHWAHQAIKAAWRYLEPRLRDVDRNEKELSDCVAACSSGIEELERTIPPFDRDSGLWIRSSKAAKAENLKAQTLASYRTKGIRNAENTLGRDSHGRVWRRTGTANSQPWYLRSTLESEKRPAKALKKH